MDKMTTKKRKINNLVLSISEVKFRDPHVTSSTKGIAISYEDGFMAATATTITAGVPESNKVITKYLTK